MSVFKAASFSYRKKGGPFKVDKQICCFGIVYEREKERKSERKKSETREREREREKGRESEKE